MGPQFLQGALPGHRGAVGRQDISPAGGAASPDHDPLARARELVDELLEMVGRERRRTAELEAERDRLLARRSPPPARPAPEDDAPDRGGEPRHGDLREALESALAAPRRRRAALVSLMGGDGP